jgi:ABC-2 type transport system permease protein
MSKIVKIIRREYMTRIRKRSFIIMTILGPILFAVFLIAPYKLANLEDHDQKVIAVVELDEKDNPVPESQLLFKNIIPARENLKFEYPANIDTSTIRLLIESSGYYGVLVINHSILHKHEAEINLYTTKQPSIGIETHITQAVENYLFEKNLTGYKLSREEIGSLKSKIKLRTSKLEKEGFKEQKLVNLKRGIGYAAGFMVYFFILFFGSQVMRGVIEEKTNRIVEVIITSVRPFQLMMGKIIGIAMVGLTQFLAWIILTAGIYQFALHSFIQPSMQKQMVQQEMMQQQISGMNMSSTGNPQELAEASGITGAIHSINPSFYLYLLGTFVFFFIGGYLLYGAMFAAIGSAVDSETDTQQFMLPVTIPLIISIIVMINAITNPEGQLVFWFSIIPFTSPVVMMARVPFNPPASELILSMALLLFTFIGMTWVAGKIYRTGILMYGKKINYRELFKWLTYKD